MSSGTCSAQTHGQTAVEVRVERVVRDGVEQQLVAQRNVDPPGSAARRRPRNLARTGAAAGNAVDVASEYVKVTRSPTPRWHRRPSVRSETDSGAAGSRRTSSIRSVFSVRVRHETSTIAPTSVGDGMTVVRTVSAQFFFLSSTMAASPSSPRGTIQRPPSRYARLPAPDRCSLPRESMVIINESEASERWISRPDHSRDGRADTTAGYSSKETLMNQRNFDSTAWPTGISR